MNDTRIFVGLNDLDAGGITGRPQCRCLGRGLLGAPKPGDPLGATRTRPAVQKSSLFGRERRPIEGGRTIDDRFDVDARPGRSDRARPERSRRRRHGRSRWPAGHRARALQRAQQGPAVFVGDDHQIGRINRRDGRRRSRAAGPPPWPRCGPTAVASAALRSLPAPGSARAFLRPELSKFQHVAPDGPAHVRRRFEPDRLGAGRRRCAGPSSGSSSPTR